MDTPRGHGPWFVALLWDTCERSKKHTEIVIHTYPHLYTHFYNNKDGSFWVILMKIGPFEEWGKCVEFFNQWSQKTRNRMARIEKGILLHQNKSSLTLWIQTKDKETIKKEYEQQKNGNHRLSKHMRIYELKNWVVSNK